MLTYRVNRSWARAMSLRRPWLFGTAALLAASVSAASLAQVVPLPSPADAAPDQMVGSAGGRAQAAPAPPKVIFWSDDSCGLQGWGVGMHVSPKKDGHVLWGTFQPTDTENRPPSESHPRGVRVVTYETAFLVDYVQPSTIQFFFAVLSDFTGWNDPKVQFGPGGTHVFRVTGSGGVCKPTPAALPGA